MGRPSRTLESVAKELLDKSIQNGECLECHLAPDTGGYGQTYYGLAHRVVWRGLFGETSLNVLHACDNRICINPYHLFAGTPKDNNDDKIAKGRLVKGKQFRAISEAQRLEMNKLYEWGWTQKDLAEHFGVSKGTIGRNLGDTYDPYR